MSSIIGAHQSVITPLMYYVYLLQCADRTIYTGITTDLKRRLSEHKSGKGGHYTRAHGVRGFLYTEKQDDRSAASCREAEIKHWSREKKLALVRAAKGRVR